MLKVRDIELDFDISRPEDLERYIRCSEEMERKAAYAPPFPETVTGLGGLAAFKDWAAAHIRLLTDWIDAVFGDGTCNRLLGPRASLSDVLALSSEIEAAAELQGQQIGMQIKKYTPNRATRRKAAGK